MDLFESLNKQYNSKKPFVVYKKANSTQAIGIFQENTNLYPVLNFKEKGFVFAPFNKGNRFYIPLENSIIKKVDLEFNAVSNNVTQDTLDNDGQNSFENLVTKCIVSIKKGDFKKVVPSRKQSIEIKVKDLSLLFKTLCNTYPTAFCSIMFHPEIGLWCGATPESLLTLEGSSLKTMALAGTQVNLGQDTVLWPEKEKQEQEFVTEFIIDTLKPYSTNIECSKPFTKRAAKVMHICTEINAELKSNDLKTIIDALHPTPAVCGLPKSESLEFLLNNEGYNREYYAGYLGELNVDFYQNKNTTDLYVNLRCMAIKQDTVDLFIGCGVTIDSDPRLEYLETVNKSSTMKGILN